ncbi:MAG TPA: hypothetical protein PKY56_03925 [Candidatus Kapabacteria bacterium]|nr:hypothetical protein [Candidatus Kapabacteria bacterium]HPO62644.1 hypothetical protein [Candidatus Kapabacteria bacterium]
MQQSNEPDNILLKIEDINNKISTILVSAANLDKKDLTLIDSFYNERQALFNQLDSWLKSDNGIEYLKKNSTFFKNKLKFILEIDEYNIKRMRNNLDDIKDKIRNLVKNKSVLKYNLTIL